MKKTTKTEKSTLALAEKFSQTLTGGEIIALIGNLGAGKTVFTKGLAKGLGVIQKITSPTFVLMKVYKINNSKNKIKTFIHIDAYRITSWNDLIAIGVEEYLGRSDTVTVIEWADKIKTLLPPDTKVIEIKNKDENTRNINFQN